MSLVIRNIANSIRLCLTLVLRIAKAKFSKHYKVFKLKQAAKQAELAEKAAKDAEKSKKKADKKKTARA